MRLKSLEIQGFKSFPDKILLSFGTGITAVVGPNGSGKSNISDAVKWVLGEQSSRSLRGSKMEDVVFTGTPTRKGQGFAEVSLIIDNTDRRIACDTDDVIVTRRYYRSGESEYKINRAAVRLRDINELFMDTGLGRDGYSIIGQGKIADIVASKSEDRREIFEEAAGISKYRYRKNEAERRLNQTEDNLIRLRDILQELEGRVVPLQEQSQKAEQFLVLSGEKRELEIGIWLHSIEKSKELLREQEHKLLMAVNQHTQVESQLETIENEIEQIYKHMQEGIVRIDEIRRAASTLEEDAVRTEGQADVLSANRAHNLENIARIEREIQQSGVSDKDIEDEIVAANGHIAGLESGIVRQNEALAAVATELEDLTKMNDDHSGQIEQQTRQLNSLANTLSDFRVASVTASSSVTEIESRLASVSEGLAIREERRQLIRAEMDAARLDLSRTEELITALGNSLRGHEFKLNSRKEKRNTMRAQAEQLRLDAEAMNRKINMLEELERNLEGFAYSVKTVMQQSRHGVLKGVHGPVSRLIKVDGQYALAVETALGGAMQHIVTATENDAKTAIAFLKKNNGGRATFLPLTSIRGSRLPEKDINHEYGFIGLAVDLCSFDAQYNGIFDSLLGRIVVAEDLDCAVAIAKKYGYKFRLVTLDGQVVNAGGSLTGGSNAKNAGLLGRVNEIDRMKKQWDTLRQQAEQAVLVLKKQEQETAASEAKFSGVRGELAIANEDRIRLEGEKRRIAEQLESVEASILNLNKERKASDLRKQVLLREKQAADVQIEQIMAQKTAIEMEVDRLSGGKQQLKARRDDLSAQLEAIKFEILSLTKDIQADKQSIQLLCIKRSEQEDKMSRYASEREALVERNEEIDFQINKLKQLAIDFRNKAAGSATQIAQMTDARAAMEQQYAASRILEREKAGERENISREIVRLEERKASVQKEYDDIIRKLWDEYELTRREAESVAAPAVEVSKAQRRLAEIKNKIKSFGSVNLGAIEEYKEVRERFEFMSEQVADIENARNELFRLIHDLTAKMRDIFIDRFNKINAQFSKIFTELFDGGTGKLSLTDPEDVLGTGIELLVQPPGKLALNQDSLSGGEKALIAIALYFAILKVSPSPFCILDEIEAALDDVNVTRYAAYLRRMTVNTQFIAITHRRGTMEEADMLYGVTMQDGVSKLLEMNTSELAKKMNIR